MILIEFGPNLCNIIVFCLIMIIALKALDFIQFLYVKDRMPNYSDEESENYVS